MVYKNIKTQYGRKNTVLGQLFAIFLIRLNSSAAFAVFFSGLSLFLTKEKNFSVTMATTLTGLFLSLNYFLPLIGGMLAKQFKSCKKLYCLGSLCSITGCFILAKNHYLYVGLAFILMNSLFSNVCIKMFVTNLFKEDQIKERKSAFLWSYVGMNAGFLLGFFLTGYYFVQNQITTLFYIISILFFIALLLTLFFINEENKEAIISRKNFYLLTMILLLTTLITEALYHVVMTQQILSAASIILLFAITFYGYALTEKSERFNFLKFISFSLLNIFFWSIYMLTPLAFMQFIEHGVDRVINSYEIAPQWFINIDSIVILIFAPLSALIVKKKNFDNLTYYVSGFFITCLSLLTLLAGLSSSSNFKISAVSMLGCLILLAIAEIYVSPTGDSLIGELIPKRLQALMTGFLSLNIGIGVVLSTHVANVWLIPYLNNNGIIGSNMIKIQQNITYIIFELLFIVIILLLSKLLGQFKKEEQFAEGV